MLPMIQFSACALNRPIWFFPPPMVGERGSPVGLSVALHSFFVSWFNCLGDFVPWVKKGDGEQTCQVPGLDPGRTQVWFHPFQ